MKMTTNCKLSGLQEKNSEADKQANSAIFLAGELDEVLEKKHMGLIFVYGS